MEDRANVGLVIVSVLFPIVGLILFFVKKKETPKAAKAYIIAAAISFVVCLLINIIVMAVAGSMVATMVSYGALMC
ncbi:hypothetical protein [Ruminococcus sp.]|uniref:hypothetical protein n=1 Tax=Ruminococcus sp. TaxID=41978 RepID=UPI0025E08E18|nr:hypothetical protein [Ruminococcus sp.]